MKDGIEFTLKSTLTEEQIDLITDVEFEHTDRIWFNTPKGKHIEFVKAQQWILCSERLPECNGVYEVTMRCEDGLYESVCYFDGQDTWHNDNRVNFDRPFVTDRVIAWMPLPEPYKAEREDKNESI